MLDQKRLKEVLEYDPVAGKFWWLVKPIHCPNWPRAGNKQGTRGYWKICVDGRAYKVSRLAWLYMTGEWPKGIVDHKDRDNSNDSWANLRLATVAQNSANSKKQTRQRLAKGVMKNFNKYIARIRVQGKFIHIGSYPTVEAAHQAYVAAAKQHFGEFGSGG